MRENPEEVLPGLDTILRAALRHGLNVEELLETFAEQTAEFGTYEDEGNRRSSNCCGIGRRQSRCWRFRG
ncbi:hypothetical protein PRIO_6759 [Paenibacillus riograndensis SBR5]|uniref:Uncharacterized protein n=1 Tax=Paenibacillus riograndensis SBR5 TaxID=1073571 RepID=A0A0E4HJ16_9BACL|nr:hypothetical protein PRIO_6759 [Paenibacillus riograndensis SBR5]